MTSSQHLPDTDPVPPDAGTPAQSPRRPGAPPGGRRSAWSLLRPALLRLHFYAGVLVAPFLLVAATSGLLYAFSPQIEQAVYADELRVPVGDERIPLADQVAAAADAHPEGTLNAVRLGEDPDESTRVLFDEPGLEESHRTGVFVDPYTGEVLGKLDSYGSSGALPVRSWISELHRHLHLGDPGRVYSELAASWLWAVAGGGVLLWVSKRRGQRRIRGVLAPDNRARGRNRAMSWHGSVGIWAVAGFFVLSATGLTWSTYAGDNIGKIREAMNWQTPALSAAEEAPGDAGRGSSGAGADAARDVGVDRALESARAAGMSGPVEVSLPASAEEPYIVQQTSREWPAHRGSVAVDQQNGEVVEELRFTDFPFMAKLTAWGIAFHMGLLFGLPNQLLLAATALSVIGLVILGYRMWFQRRPTASGGFAPGRPFPRGAWRTLPLGTRVLLVAAAVGIGVLLPVFGVSLLLFLVVDGVVAAGRRRRNRRVSGPETSPEPRSRAVAD
ncbi:putative iron-regulated membrane protein [Lipingzhangella halophila]|uniref:Putative iron-regulated membrane protein n=1 Tax=Lipingzhangella halophila TaxID=1783352 RepID=A0A7W7W643_9ACTN|nr:PepSY domain-containing protein [Lipingzhangella halophila]MBB4934529.1 putative iron-regulated membrane protein [Lipingzhangella halophila]